LFPFALIRRAPAVGQIEREIPEKEVLRLLIDSHFGAGDGAAVIGPKLDDRLSLPVQFDVPGSLIEVASFRRGDLRRSLRGPSAGRSGRNAKEQGYTQSFSLVHCASFPPQLACLKLL
jgi:hypothetical protein